MRDLGASDFNIIGGSGPCCLPLLAPTPMNDYVEKIMQISFHIEINITFT